MPQQPLDNEHSRALARGMAAAVAWVMPDKPIKTLEKLVAELEQHPAVTLLEHKPIEGAPAEHVAGLREELRGAGLSDALPALEPYLGMPMSMRVGWEYEDKGNAAFSGLGGVFLHNPAVALLDDRFAVPGAPGLKYLDRDLQSDLREGATLSFRDGALAIGYHMGGKSYATDLTLETYLTTLRQTRGFLRWQGLYCTDMPAELRKELTRDHWTPMARVLVRLFPKEDLTVLLRRVAAASRGK
jgi:hypothetical protein